VYGIEGHLLLNLKTLKNNKFFAFNGIFHFGTISLASGNIIIFEENDPESNNILI